MPYTYFEPSRVEEMLAQADALSIHVPLTDETKGLVGANYIASLKRGAVIINTARGAVVDEEAMIAALKSGQISAIGLDVYPDEPKVNEKLFELGDKVTLLPHVGTDTVDTQHKMEARALKNLAEFLTGGVGSDLVAECKGVFKPQKPCA